ncbi:MAG: DUF47 domain-containing protein [Methanomicrobiales archaeon]|nr:DUF47 domain-containing protein [Methanomicrobiales archaeon]
MSPKKRTRTPRKFVEIIDAIFPTRYDFEEMLAEQADRTLEGVRLFVDWLDHHAGEEPAALGRIEADVDAFRYSLEEKLGDSFSTPFDRQDIYSLSRQMDYILGFSYATAREMHLFQVAPDRPIREMAGALLLGTGHVAAGVRAMGSDQKKVREAIREARRTIHTVGDTYMLAMKDLFGTPVTMDMLKRREVYHHLWNAGGALQATVDILHKAVVGIDLGGD